MKGDSNPHLPFNTPLETGIRSIALLAAVYPRSFDLQRMVGLDHLVVHTGDVGGPKSLHPAVPFRSAELLVRRNLIERGLLLMLSRKLIERRAAPSGVVYIGAELAAVF